MWKMRLEVLPYRNPMFCALCWWEARVACLHNQIDNAVVLLDGVPLCERHLRELLMDMLLRLLLRHYKALRDELQR